MALIECSECGHKISDKAQKCPKCGYPMFKQDEKADSTMIGEVKFQENNAADATATTVEKQNTPEIGQPSAEVSKKRFLKPAIIGIAAVVVIAIVAIYVGIGGSKRVSISNIEIDKWKMTDQSSYGNNYDGTVVSNEKTSFIAVVGSYEEDRLLNFVYMEDGKGVFKTFESTDVDPSTKYYPLGYIQGKSMTDSDLKKVEYVDNDYHDFETLGMTSCMGTIDLQFEKSATGLLFFEVRNDLNTEVSYNSCAVIIDGKGTSQYYLSDLPLKSRNVGITVTPKYFCSAEGLKDTDYSVEKGFSVTFDEGEYYKNCSGKEELKFPGFSDGYVLFTEELIEGGNKKNRGEVVNRGASLKDEYCIITTYDYIEKEETLLEPVYDINIKGFIKWTLLEKKEK